jgi:hypothetical protein
MVGCIFRQTQGQPAISLSIHTFCERLQREFIVVTSTNSPCSRLRRRRRVVLAKHSHSKSCVIGDVEVLWSSLVLMRGALRPLP